MRTWILQILTCVYLWTKPARKKRNRHLMELRRRFQRPTKESFEPDTMSSFQKTPASRRPANTYSAHSFDRINYFNMSHLLPRTQTSLSRWKCARKGRREGDNGRDVASPAFSTLPMVRCGSSPVVRLYLAKNEAPDEYWMAHLHFDLNLLSMESLFIMCY